MVTLGQMTDEQFERHALEILQRELGPAGLARFLRLHRSGPGDYTEHRQAWRKDLPRDELLTSIRQHRRLTPFCGEDPSIASADSQALSGELQPELRKSD